MSKIFARLRRATFTSLPRAGPLLSFCPKSTASSAFSVLTQIGRTFRIPSDYGEIALNRLEDPAGAQLCALAAGGVSQERSQAQR